MKKEILRTVVAKEADYSVVPQSCQIECVSDKEGYPAYVRIRQHLDRD